MLKPEIERKAMVENARISSLDFGSRIMFDKRRWEFTTRKFTAGDPDGYAQAHLKKPVKQAMLYFPKPQFKEAVVTGQVLVHEATTPTPEDWHIIGCGIGRREKGRSYAVSSLCTQSEGSVVSRTVSKRWRWFCMHADYRGNGRWLLRYWIWMEGRQPADIRAIDLGTLPPTQRQDMLAIDTDDITRSGMERDVTDWDPTAGLGLMGQYLTATWRGLGVQVIRPADAPLYREDFEKGLGGWVEHIDDEQVKGRKHLSTVKIDTPRGPSTVLRVDCAGTQDKTIVARLPFVPVAKAIAVECDARIEERYDDTKPASWMLSCRMRPTGTKEILKESSQTVVVGKWCRYRRELVIRKDDRGWAVFTTSYVDGKLSRRARLGLDEFDNCFQIGLGVTNGRAVFDNIVVKELNVE